MSRPIVATTFDLSNDFLIKRRDTVEKVRESSTADYVIQFGTRMKNYNVCSRLLMVFEHPSSRNMTKASIFVDTYLFTKEYQGFGHVKSFLKFWSDVGDSNPYRLP
jgi:hypothetical protein